MSFKINSSHRLIIVGLFILMASGGLAYLYKTSPNRKPSSTQEAQSQIKNEDSQKDLSSQEEKPNATAAVEVSQTPDEKILAQDVETSQTQEMKTEAPASEPKKSLKNQANESFKEKLVSRSTVNTSMKQNQVMIASQPAPENNSSSNNPVSSQEHASTPSEQMASPVRTEIHSPSQAIEENKLVGLKIFAGLGANYVQYDELLTDVTTKYRDFRAPSYHFGMCMDLSQRIAIETTYKSTPMRFDNSSVELSALHGNWQTVGLQGVTSSGSKVPESLVESSASSSGQNNQFKWLWGFQFHNMPIALFDDFTNAPVMRTIQLINASIGAGYDHYLNPHTKAQIFMRAQYPLVAQSTAGSSSFSAQPNVLFDGSIGVEKKVRPGRWVGLHWYGQYQSLNFKYQDPKTTAAGTHNVLFSNIEARITFEF